MAAPQSPRVSVVMPVHNRRAYVAAAIESVLIQSLRELEVIVVDDGSTDDTPAIIEEYARRDSRVRVARLAKSGISRAINHGVAMARAPYIARLDSDDIALPNRLARQLAFLDANPSVGLVGSWMILIDDASRVTGYHTYPLDAAQLHADVIVRNVIGAPSAVIRHDVIEAIGGWRPQYDDAEDYEFCLRLSERSTLVNLPEFLVFYRRHAQQNTKQRFGRQQGLSVVARIAARARRAGLPDPVDPARPIDAAAIDRLGLPADEAEKLKVALA